MYPGAASQAVGERDRDNQLACGSHRGSRYSRITRMRRNRALLRTDSSTPQPGLVFQSDPTRTGGTSLFPLSMRQTPASLNLELEQNGTRSDLRVPVSD